MPPFLLKQIVCTSLQSLEVFISNTVFDLGAIQVFKQKAPAGPTAPHKALLALI